MLARTDESMLAKWWLGLDKSVLLEALFLIVIGGLMVFSASPYSANRINIGEYSYIKKYLAYFVLGIGTLFASSMLSARQVKRLGIVLFALFAAFLFMTLFDQSIKGSRRWITRLGPSFQPSEFLKPAAAVVAALVLVKIKELSAAGETKKMKRWICALICAFGAIAALLLLQPDRGMMLTFLAILTAEAFVAGIKWKWIALLAGTGAASIGASYMTSGYVAARIDKFLFAGGGDTYQIDMGLKAIREAGLFGGHTNNLKQSIPDVHTDFIFSAMVEEFGALLTIIVIAVFFMMGARIFLELKARRSAFTIYAVTGIAAHLLFQVCVNLLSTLGLIPTKGMTLPFISYGGSSFVSSCLGLGLVLALLQEYNSRDKPANKNPQEKFSAGKNGMKNEK